MQVSFIIPHKGREELLQQTIQSIVQLEFDRQAVEILVVTQNEQIESLTAFEQIAALTIIYRPATETISALRNIGARQARGDYLAFIDADITLAPNWLAVMLAEMQAKPGRALVSSKQQAAAVAGVIEQMRVVMQNSTANQAVQFLDGRNLFVSREVFERAGGFPEHLVTCEDYYFTNSVHQLGEVFVSAQTSYVHLGEDKSFAELFRKEIWRGQSNLRSLRGRPLTLRELPSILIPFWIAILAVVTVGGFLAAKFWLALLAAMLTIAPLELYTLRLYKLGQGRVRLLDALRFYSVYFPARVIGTFVGVFKTL